jgi:hypothetical protein
MFSEELLNEEITEREVVERLGLQEEFTDSDNRITSIRNFIEEILQEEVFNLKDNLHDWIEEREAAGEDVLRYKCDVCCGDEGGPDALCAYHSASNTDPYVVEVLVA